MDSSKKLNEALKKLQTLVLFLPNTEHRAKSIGHHVLYTSKLLSKHFTTTLTLISITKHKNKSSWLLSVMPIVGETMNGRSTTQDR